MSAHRNLDRSPEDLARHFISYAEGVRGTSPLYGRLLLAVAEGPDLLVLAGEARRDQPAALLILASVHYLLLREERSSPLALYYPSVVGTAARIAGDAAPAFRRFCLEHREAISELLSSRRVQTTHIALHISAKVTLRALLISLFGQVLLGTPGIEAAERRMKSQ